MDSRIEEWAREVDRLDGGQEILCEMAKVADFNGYKLIVWSNDEGLVPHFHIVRGKSPLNQDFDAYIKFMDAEYYPHGGRHTDRLPPNQLKTMIDLLNSRDQFAIGDQAIWQTLLVEWNRNDNGTKISVDTKMPDYRHIVFPTK